MRLIFVFVVVCNEKELQADETNNYRMTGTGGERTSNVNRFDDEPEQERSADDEEEKKRAKRQMEVLAKRRFQKIGLTVLQSFHLPSREEQLDFFSRPWDKYDDELEELEAKRKEQEEAKKRKKSSDDVDEIVAEDETKTRKKEDDDKANGERDFLNFFSNSLF